MWVLILSVMSTYSDEPVALTTADGFGTYQSSAKAKDVKEIKDRLDELFTKM